MAVAEDKLRERVKENLEKSKKTAEKGDKTKKKAKSKAQFEKNKYGVRKGTVIDTICKCLEKGATFKEMKEVLKKEHPEREIDAMEKTLRLQLYRLPKEKGLIIKQDDATKKYKVIGVKAVTKAAKKVKPKDEDEEEETEAKTEEEDEEEETEAKTEEEDEEEEEEDEED